MIKADIIRFLEPFDDEIEVKLGGDLVYNPTKTEDFAFISVSPPCEHAAKKPAGKIDAVG